MAQVTTTGPLPLTGTGEEAGFLSRLVQRMIAARSAEAQRLINTHLLTLDDATLERLGYDREEIGRSTPGGYPLI